jgi:hypothetical protein
MELRAERDEDHGVVGELHRQAFLIRYDCVGLRD